MMQNKAMCQTCGHPYFISAQDSGKLSRRSVIRLLKESKVGTNLGV